MTQIAQPHGFVTKGIHWLSAGLIGYGYFKGLDSVGQLADPGVLQFEVFFALLLGIVFTLRLLWARTQAGASRLPQTAPRWEHLASRGVHWGLYASVFGIIGSGLGLAAAYSLPALGRVAVETMVAVHEVFLALMPTLLLIHIAGALWHKVVRRDGVLESMTGKLPI